MSKLIYRKLEYKDEFYYQLYRIVGNNVEIDVKDTKPSKNVEEFYEYDIDIEDETMLKNTLYTYYGLEEDELYPLDNPILITELAEEFYKKFQDFEVVPKNDFDISKIKDSLSDVILYQDEAINEVLNVIKSNLDIIDLDIPLDKKSKLKHNIILYGPKGYGKNTFIDCILQNTNVPCTILELNKDPDKNLNLIIAGLGISSFGNMQKAENGIVLIKDNFDELEEELNGSIEPMDLVESLLMVKSATLGNDTKMKFDMSKITYVLVKNTPGNCIDFLYNEGLEQSLIDRFGRIVCFKRLQKNEIKDILLKDPNSILNMYKEICLHLDKELIVEDDFLDTLIERAYYDVGGINLFNKYIEAMIKLQWGNKKIILDKELVIKVVEDSSYCKDWIEGKDDITNVEEEQKEEETATTTSEFKIDLPKLRETYRTNLLSIMEYVKGQDEPLKNILYHALMNDVIQNSNLPMERKKERINHMLIRGGTGSGKSYITNCVANVLNKPYAEIDCKRYTEAGYVGKNIDDMLIKLYYAAGGNLEKAQKGILFLDEIDKLSRRNSDSSNVSRGAVQESLLKLMEGTIFDLEIKDENGKQIVNFDTRELTIIGAGAFEGLSKIRDSRIRNGTKKQTIGFQSVSSKEEIVDKNYTLSDMQEFGMDAQLLRRMPFQCDLNELTKEDYRNIMLNSKSSAFKIKQARLEMLGVSLGYDEEFIDSFTEKVSKLGFGVSGINVLTERIFSSFETTLLENDYDKVVLTKECVEDPKKVILIDKNDEKGIVYKKQI